LSSGIQLIVGLGNPGEEHAATRHNAGAWFVLELARSINATLRPDSKFHGLHCNVKQYGHDFHLFIPTRFMNLSGQSVAAFLNYYKIPPKAMLVAHDEIDIPIGDIRLKFDGGHAGHNGLRNIIDHLGTHQFHRLRIGVGRPENSKNVVSYVLKPPTKTERKKIDVILHNALCVVPDLLDGQFQKATQALHTK